MPTADPLDDLLRRTTRLNAADGQGVVTPEGDAPDELGDLVDRTRALHNKRVMDNPMAPAEERAKASVALSDRMTRQAATVKAIEDTTGPIDPNEIGHRAAVEATNQRIHGGVLGPLVSFGASIPRTLVTAGSAIAPETFGELGAKMDEYYGTPTNVIERTAAAAAPVVGSLAAGPAAPALLAGTFGASGAGRVREEIAQRRGGGQEISGGQELAAATLTGAIDAASGYVGGKLFQGAGQILKGVPGLGGIVAKQGARGIVDVLKAEAPGLVESVGVGAAMQFADNIVKKLTFAPEQSLSEGVGEAAAVGGVLHGLGRGLHVAGEKASKASIEGGATETSGQEPNIESKPAETQAESARPDSSIEAKQARIDEIKARFDAGDVPPEEQRGLVKEWEGLSADVAEAKPEASPLAVTSKPEDVAAQAEKLSAAARSNNRPTIVAEPEAQSGAQPKAAAAPEQPRVTDLPKSPHDAIDVPKSPEHAGLVKRLEAMTPTQREKVSERAPMLGEEQRSKVARALDEIEAAGKAPTVDRSGRFNVGIDAKLDADTRDRIRRSFDYRRYEPGSMMSGTSLANLDSIASNGLKTSSAHGGNGVWMTEVSPAGTFLPHRTVTNREGVPIVLKLKSEVRDIAKPVPTKVGVHLVEGTVPPSMIEGVYVADDPHLYTLDEAVKRAKANGGSVSEKAPTVSKPEPVVSESGPFVSPKAETGPHGTSKEPAKSAAPAAERTNSEKPLEKSSIPTQPSAKRNPGEVESTSASPELFDKVEELAGRNKPEKNSTEKLPNEPTDFTQRRAVDNPPEGEPEGPVTSARNAMMAGDRKALGLDTLDGPERRSWAAALDTAVERKIPDNALRIAAEVATSPRSLSDVETAGLVHKANTLKNEHRAALEGVDKLKDPADIQFKAAEAARIEAEFDAISTALKHSGTETGRALASRRLTIDQDHSIIALKSRLKAAKGAPLSEKENARIEDLSRQLEERDRKIESMQKLADEQQAERTIKRHAGRKRGAQSRDEEFTSLVAKAKSLLGQGCS